MTPRTFIDGLSQTRADGNKATKLDLVAIIFCFAPQAVALAASGFFFFAGATKYFDIHTLISTVVAILTSVAIAIIGLRVRSGILLCLIFLGNILVFPRIVQFLLMPEAVYFPFPTPLTVVEINIGIIAYSATLAAFALGAIAASTLLPAPSQAPQETSRDRGMPKTYLLLFLFFVFAAIEIYVQHTSAMRDYKSHFEYSESISLITKLIVVIFSSDTVLFLTILISLRTAARSGDGISLSNFLAVIVATTAFIMLYASLGSRGSGMRVLLMVVACAFSLDWRSTRYSAQVALIAAFAVFGTVGIYPLAEALRQGVGLESIGDAYVEPEGSTLSASGSQVATVLNRLANFDYVAITASREPTEVCAAKYLNWSYAARNVANQFAIGDPFPEARISTSNAFRLCYGEKSESDLTSYQSEIWTLLGLAKAFFGGFAIIGCAIVGFFVQLIANMLRRSSQPWLHTAYAFYLFLMPSAVMYSMGLDHSINIVVMSYVRLLVSMVAVESIFWLLGKARRWRPL